jgi:hypothetical protein
VPLVALVAFFSFYAHYSYGAAFRRTQAEISGDLYSGRDGAKEAQAARARGKFLLLDYGLLLPWDEERREVARKKFGIEYRVIGGCIITESAAKFAASYNQVMQAEIVSRFGSEVFGIMNRDGEALLTERWSKKAANSERSTTP